MATKKALTVEERLQNIYQLQEIDSKLDEIKVLKGELPIEVEDLEDEIKGLETRNEKTLQKLESLDDEINEFKKRIATSKTLIERYKAQLDDVKNNREYEALTKEIELQDLDIKLSEKKMAEVEVSKVQRKEAMDENNKRIAEKNDLLSTKKVELGKIIEKTEKEEDKLASKSEKARKNIDDRILKSYDKIRSSYRNGIAVATIMRNSCSGCFNRIPPQLQIEIGLRKNIIACEHCGRILVDNGIAGVEADSPKDSVAMED